MRFPCLDPSARSGRIALACAAFAALASLAAVVAPVALLAPAATVAAVAPVAHVARRPPAQASAPDVFAPGLRWTHAAGAAEPWLPRDVAFAGRGELVWAAGAIGSPRWMAFCSGEPGAADGELAPLFDALEPAALTQAVAAGPGTGALFALAQFASPDATHRRTELACYDARDGNGPAWRHDLGLVGNGAALLAADSAGTRVAVAVHDAATGELLVRWIDGASGAPTSEVRLFSQALRQIALSSDGRRLALVAGAELWVLSESGATLHHEALSLATRALALSGDGRTLLVGSGNRVRVLAEQASAFGERFAAVAPSQELATRVAVSDDGATYAIGWWNASSGSAVRFQVWDGARDALLFEHVREGSPSGLQDFPQALAVTPDGRRAAFGSWGVLDPSPELVLVDVPSRALVLAIDLPGSVESLALDSSGTRVAVGVKHAHANQFASTGELRLYDTGERDLQALGPARPGERLHLASRRTGASRILFLLGSPGAWPTNYAWADGTLWLDRSARMRVVSRAADASGRADADVLLPLDSALLGLDFAVQSAARVAGRLVFSSTCIEPPLL